MSDWPVGLSTGCFYQKSIFDCLEPILAGGFSLVEICSFPAHLDYHDVSSVRRVAERLDACVAHRLTPTRAQDPPSVGQMLRSLDRRPHVWALKEERFRMNRTSSPDRGTSLPRLATPAAGVTKTNLNPAKTMLAKYKVEYAIPFHGHEQSHHYLTDDPVTCEEFLTQLLERGFKIKEVLHQGTALPKADFDKMLKTAAGILTGNHLCRSLGIDRAEANHRFGVPA